MHRTTTHISIPQLTLLLLAMTLTDVSNRTKHAKLLSRKAAKVAVKEKAQSKREEQVRFASDSDAHRSES